MGGRSQEGRPRKLVPARPKVSRSGQGKAGQGKVQASRVSVVGKPSSARNNSKPVSFLCRLVDYLLLAIDSPRDPSAAAEDDDADDADGPRHANRGARAWPPEERSATEQSHSVVTVRAGICCYVQYGGYWMYWIYSTVHYYYSAAYLGTSCLRWSDAVRPSDQAHSAWR
jgi:hypothetical protein